MRKGSLVVLAVGLVAVATSCTPLRDLTPGPSPLDGTKWQLSGWSVDSLDPTQFEITATFEKGRISGSSSVNSYSGPYTSGPASAFSVGPLAVGSVGGLGPDKHAEDIYLRLLGHATSFKDNGTVLTLLDGGNASLVFEKTA
jgi:heat shock protein HslJ